LPRVIEAEAMSNDASRDQVVMITGASAGIGEALAREAASDGASVVLLARRLERVERLAQELSAAGGRALGLACDVTRDGDLERAVDKTCEAFGGIDVVIANAGFGIQGALMDLDLDDYRRQLETNVFGVVRTAKATLGELVKSQGRLAVVGSANGYFNVPNWSAYCMSKHAVRSFCACIRHELAPLGVSVTHLVPGFITSEFRRVTNAGELSETALDPVPRWLQMPADKAARQMLRAIARRREREVVTQHARLVVELERLAPSLVSRAIAVSGRVVARLSKNAS
jgi:short-subunit dehydrogenase